MLVATWFIIISGKIHFTKITVLIMQLTRDPLSLDWRYKPIAILYNTAIPGRHKADNDFLALWRGSETQIELFYKFKRRKELVVVL
jgi:hypothetical protein